MLFLVVLLYFHSLLLKVDENLIGVIVLAGVPNLHELGGYLNDDLGVLVGVFVIAPPEVLLVQALKFPAGLVHHQTLIFRDALNLYAAPAQGHMGILVELLGFAEILVGLKPHLVVIKQAAHIAYHHIVVYRAGQSHDFPVAQLVKHECHCLWEGQSFVRAEVHLRFLLVLE